MQRACSALKSAFGVQFHGTIQPILLFLHNKPMISLDWRVCIARQTDSFHQKSAFLALVSQLCGFSLLEATMILWSASSSESPLQTRETQDSYKSIKCRKSTLVVLAAKCLPNVLTTCSHCPSALAWQRPTPTSWTWLTYAQLSIDLLLC